MPASWCLPSTARRGFWPLKRDPPCLPRFLYFSRHLLKRVPIENFLCGKSQNTA
jgi:hypothetical protein